ncbi:MAG: hypothetical protein IJ003_02570 [Candidatus Gastranaerophilales bacterium]|nr:hypothetical protein [Candidatus Gastranaerophilales bacterium]
MQLIKKINAKMKFSKAFSMFEMLGMLIIVSIATAAFAPVMTKRLKNPALTTNTIKTSCDHIDEDCSLCKKNTCYSCNKNCKPTEYKDTASCKCIDCSASVGAGCILCEKDKCKKCTVGYKLNTTTNKCEPCPATSYQDIEGQTTCKLCPLDHSCTLTSKEHCPEQQGSNLGSNYCAVCRNVPALVHCYECIDFKDQKCIQCDAGYYLNSNNECSGCAIDNYCDGKSQIQCGGGQGANANSASCTVCSTVSALTSNCLECTDLSTCIQCKAGYYLSSGKCVACEAGYKCDGKNRVACSGADEFQDATAQSECKLCKAVYGDMYQKASNTGCKQIKCPDNGQYILNKVCTDCPIDTKCDGMNKYSCETGYGANKKSTSCTKCSSVLTACAECTDLNTCTACQSGYYLSGGKCYTCGAGTYINGTTCTPCPKDTYNPWSGQYSCTPCPTGATTTGTGATSSSECQTCTAGQSYINGQCVSCSEVYGSKCTACDANGCTSAGCAATPAWGTTYGGTVYSKATFDGGSGNFTSGKWACASCWDWWSWCLWCTPKSDGSGVKCTGCYDGYTLNSSWCKKNS